MGPAEQGMGGGRQGHKAAPTNPSLCCSPKSPTGTPCPSPKAGKPEEVCICARGDPQGGSFPAWPLLPPSSLPSSPSPPSPRPPEAAVGIPVTATICQPFIPQTKEQLLINTLERNWGGGAIVAVIGHSPCGNTNTAPKQPPLVARLPTCPWQRDQKSRWAVTRLGPCGGWAAKGSLWLEREGEGSPRLLEEALPPFPS